MNPTSASEEDEERIVAEAIELVLEDYERKPKRHRSSEEEEEEDENPTSDIKRVRLDLAAELEEHYEDEDEEDISFNPTVSNGHGDFIPILFEMEQNPNDPEEQIRSNYYMERDPWPNDEFNGFVSKALTHLKTLVTMW